MRVVILGNSGAGKSTLAKAVAERHQLPHTDLDTVVFDPARVGVMRTDAAIRHDLTALATTNTWVGEGSYGRWAGHLAARATHFVFLNPPMAVCLDHHRSRPWEPHKYADPAEQAARLPMLEAWVRRYPTRDDDFGERAHRAVFETVACARLEAVDARAALAWLACASRPG